MKFSLNLFFLTILLFALDLKAQTSAEIDRENNERYWIYRDRFRKRFVFIGRKDGQSLPFLTLFEGYNTPIIPQSTLSDNTKTDSMKQTMISGRMSKGEMGYICFTFKNYEV